MSFQLSRHLSSFCKRKWSHLSHGPDTANDTYFPKQLFTIWTSGRDLGIYMSLE